MLAPRHPRIALAALLLLAGPGVCTGQSNEAESGSGSVPTLPAAEAEPPAENPPNLPLRNALVIGTGASLIAAYGFTNWWDDGFGGGFKAESEGWFGQGTEYGGMDKLGHFFANYVGVRLLTPTFMAVGNDRDAAIRLATWSTFITFAAVEVLDGYSVRYEFGREDFVANVAGVLFGYVMERNQRLDEIFDFRLYYRQSSASSNWDPFGDYEGQRYFLVAKADAFEPLRNNRLTRYLELAVGYSATGFDPPPPPGMEPQGQGTLYVGLSLNLSRLLADALYGGRKGQTRVERAADLAFELIQFPTIVTAETDVY